MNYIIILRSKSLICKYIFFSSQGEVHVGESSPLLECLEKYFTDGEPKHRKSQKIKVEILSLHLEKRKKNPLKAEQKSV